MDNTQHSASEGDDIAIVGMGCNFPHAPNLDAYWSLLETGGNGISHVPGERWNSAYFMERGEIQTDWGGFLDNLKAFDAKFFQINPKAANVLDPQQRLLFQVVWHALENAGLDGLSLKDSKTGVYTGCATGEYFHILNRSLESDEVNAYIGIGNSYAATSGRISYFLGTQGPALTVDTACSSSMVAAHLGCRDLVAGAADMAIISGTNVLLNPFGYISFSRAKMLAPDGRCKTFDKDADGYVRSEGMGTIICKRYADAVQAGDRIWAVIHGTAVNQDGAGNGFTAPNGRAQVSLYSQTLEAAGKMAKDIDWIECHGTGTRLGDPIEVDSIQEIYGALRTTPLYISSVKTNIGHLEAAAGVASMIKVALSLKNRKIPGHRNFNQLNPFIKLNHNTKIPLTLLDMETSRTYQVGISSFGITGTNSHMIMSEAPEIHSTVLPHKHPAAQTLSFPISAVSRTAFLKRAGELKAWLNDSKPDLQLLSSQMWIRQSHFPLRICLLANSHEELSCQLEQAATNIIEPQPIQKRRKIAFLFTGQGSEYHDMGKELYEWSPVYRTALDACVQILGNRLEIPLIDLMFDKKYAHELHQRQNAHVALFALDYAVAQLWISLGMKPGFVAGYGVGELVAAVISGVLSLDAGLELVYWRARYLQAVPKAGAGVAVSMSEADVHSAEDMLHTYREKLDRVEFNTPRFRIVSTLTGTYDRQQVFDKHYFLKHLVATVRFEDSVDFLVEKAVNIYLEIGPESDLSTSEKTSIEKGKSKALTLPSLRQTSKTTFWHTLKMLYQAGCTFKKSGIERHLPSRNTFYALPLYPFDKHEYWFSYGSRRDLQEIWADHLTITHDDYNIFKHHQTDRDVSLTGGVL